MQKKRVVLIDSANPTISNPIPKSKPQDVKPTRKQQRKSIIPVENTSVLEVDKQTPAQDKSGDENFLAKIEACCSENKFDLIIEVNSLLFI